MVAVTENLSTYLESFAALAGEQAHDPVWLRRRRRLSLQRFAELGIPTLRDEEWKYTNLSALAKAPFHTIDTSAPAANAVHLDNLQHDGLTPADADSIRLVFVDGRYQAELSQLDAPANGIKVGNLAALLGKGGFAGEGALTQLAGFDDHALVALNTALFTDGAYVAIGDRTVVEKPIHLVFLTTAAEPDTLCCPRTLVIAGRESKAAIIETHLGLGGETYWSNAVGETFVGENARLDHYTLRREQPEGLHTAFTYVRQARDSRYVSHSFALGGRLVRGDLDVTLADEGAHCELNGLYAVRGSQHVDHHTVIRHTMPHSTSHQLYKGMLDGRARGVFNGKIIVSKDAQKTDAIQSNKNLLLSPDAEVNTKPQLEIEANDVRCTHGATVGQIDEEATFYLRSRGIGREEARNLLTYAFAGDVVGRIGVEPLAKQIEEYLMNWLSADSEAEARP